MMHASRHQNKTTPLRCITGPLPVIVPLVGSTPSDPAKLSGAAGDIPNALDRKRGAIYCGARANRATGVGHRDGSVRAPRDARSLYASFKIALVFVRRDQVARCIVNANRSIM
jgi:hypothetical protein